ncbi:unnamed protein product [Coregonus sp. 'balchen']|nr:unnamed protein product [Coregonus sp. 'balchen']
MAQISSGNGFKLDMAQPKGVVGKEEALRMEAEALAKLQREKRQTLPATTTSSSSTSSSSASSKKKLPAAARPTSSSNRPEKDLIVFPEAKKHAEKDKFRDIDVDKLTNKELEKLLLDDSFGANSSKASRPSLLLGFNLSASYPGGHATCSPSHLHSGQWMPSLLSTPSSSCVFTPTHQQAPMFPSAPFPKPENFSFCNGFSPAMPPYMGLHGPQTSFMAFTPIQQPGAMVFQQPTVTLEMAKLFDKIHSTSEYLKNGRSASTDLDSASTSAVSLAPNPPPPAVESPTVSRFEWLDLDPLNKRKAEGEEGSSPASRGTLMVVGGDPWDAVLFDETEGGAGGSSPPVEVKGQLAGRSHPRRSSTGAAVTRNHTLTIPASSSQHKPNNQHDNGSGKALTKLRSKFAHDDLHTNPGYVLSAVIPQRDGGGDNGCSVKVSIEISDSPVELLIMQALCWVHDDLNQVDIGSYVLKVCGQEEVLQKKWEAEIKLQLLSQSTMRRDLARTAEDNTAQVDLERHMGQVERPFKENVTRQGLSDYLEGYHNQVNICLQNESTQYKTVDRVVQTVKNLCCALDEVETQAITEAVKGVKRSVNLPRTRSPEVGSKSSGGSANGHLSPVEESMGFLTDAVYDLAKLYLRSFCPAASSSSSTPSPDPSSNSQHAEGESAAEGRGSKEASGTTDHLQFTLFAMHGIPAAWVSSYEKYYLMCALTHNGRNLFKPIQSKKVGTYKSFFYHIKWDELINFPMAVALLPLESMLTLSLFGVLNQNASGSPDSNKQRKGPEVLGKVSLPLFDFRRVLARGTKLLCLWTSPQAASAAAGSRRKNLAERIILQVDFPSPMVDVLYVGPQESPCPDPNTLEELDPDLRRRVEKLCSRASTFGLTRADRQLLWDQRHHCRAHTNSLPKVLASSPSWDWGSMAEIHSLLHHWPSLQPVCALELLDSKFADTEVRSVAVSWIESSSDDELADYLPQLVQALKFECHLKNALVIFLLSRAQGNVSITLYLYWYDQVLGALLCLCGAGLRAELDKQTRLVTLLGALAEKVRQAGGSTRQMVLQEGMVELVPSSDTLRKIQVEYGVTGSFKDKPLAEWLRKYNPAEDEYEKNFIYSCAGCCVATYVLGICDRHNDNIMLRSTGHMFHIDFGKFLGHAQMFGSFRRDRAPFVLTSDMAYVINGGERPTSRFQLFVDLCSQAYNLIRKHSGLFLNLLSLMTLSGLPELTGAQDLKYVYDALQPQTTDAEATIFFTRLIETSLGSVATKFNFFIHNLAQMRFSGLPSNDEPILSFSPKTYTLKQEGRIRDASIFSFQKRYNPDKHYTYVVRLLREGQSEAQFLLRTFDEFQELHNKLCILFPLWKLPGFPNRMVLGRTHIKDVAAKRKIELNSYVHNLLRSSTEVTQGEVKLSVSYRNSTLFIMVMHIRDLVSEEGTDPNPYVKTYLLPDPHKTSKCKTKISRKTRNPTFNEMLVYSDYSKETLGLRELQLSVLSAESLRENCYLGGVTLKLKDFDLSKETVNWYKLTAVPYF